MKVLVTGGAGSIGRVVCAALQERGHAVRNFDRFAAPGVADNVIGDLEDAAAVDAAAADQEAVVHLAAYPNPADFVAVLIPSNFVGVYHVMEAAVHRNVRRVVLASSMQVVNRVPRPPDRPLRVSDGTASTNLYGVSKVFAEEMGRYYANMANLSVLAARIGWFPRNAAEAARIRKMPACQDVYLSHADCGRFFALAVESERPRPGEAAVLFATSRPVQGHGLDLQSAAEWIGYVPQHAWPEGIEVAETLTDGPMADRGRPIGK